MIDRISRLCVIGLGYVGLPTAVAFATNNVEVIGVDVAPERVMAINAGATSIAEPNLDALLRRAVASGKLRAQQHPTAADAFIIAVPTPLKNGHVPDLSYLQAASGDLAPVLESGNLVVLESTSPVGTTELLCQWLSELRPDLSFPHSAGMASDIRVAYSAERVLPGRILAELVNNDRVIGGVTPACAEATKTLYGIFLKGACSTTDPRTAELVKLAENAYRDVNIAFANEVASICDYHGVDTWELIELANRHPRVDVLGPGPGVGGHCVAVDPWFIVHGASGLTPLIETARCVNDARPRKIVECVIAACKGAFDVDIACLGLSYKADTGDLRESPSILVVQGLQEATSGRLLVVEPHIQTLPPELTDNARTELVTLQEALHSSRVAVLLTDHHEFRALDATLLDGKIVVDTRGAWQPR
ncbi:MAG: UDP-N-acetyl-D-mannosamine dehydrogenase [Rhodospirillales bacterium]|nr:UDP-N-acetyl-D-mannosamine dehydrogenase [Rhodospirillales bacterium]